ncbi:TPA: uroporphyrinogen III methylase [Legionella pneumophila]|nr:uroporphyrinogen III methylase [Legionella pneumophila]HBD9406925.1 uroporphyrinogen III methylase [Legionella pneumophila]HBI2969972.1 uroporphyrinogen III methylase [Legionella pneumophila]
MSKQLSLIGCGIKIIAHLSKEAESHINKAEIVLFLVNEPVMEEWIGVHARKVKNLSGLYFSQKNRESSYRLITKEILHALECYEFVCVVFYGHPTVFALPGLEAIKKAKENGVETKIIPAISAEDCLFADLEIDPGECGCYSVEATDLLVYQRHPDTSSHLLVWQVGMLGNLGHEAHLKTDAIELFVEYLLKFYSENHVAVIYEASIYPGLDCIVKKFMLKELRDQRISKIAILYIPPEEKKSADSLVLKKLGFI